MRRVRAAWLLTGLLGAYTAFAVGLLLYARIVALPTAGGISPSEVLEALFPGGLAGMLAVWGALFLLMTAAWAWRLWKR